jgi:hypothetical protein
MEDLQKTALAASRALSDPTYAKSVLEGEQEEPEVRDALLADIGAAEAEGLGGMSKRTSNLQQLIDRAKPW